MFHLVPLVTVPLLTLCQTILDPSPSAHGHIHGPILVLADSLETSEQAVANNIHIRIVVGEFETFCHF